MKLTEDVLHVCFIILRVPKIFDKSLCLRDVYRFFYVFIYHSRSQDVQINSFVCQVN